MKFQKPQKNISFPKMEEEILSFWKNKNIFQRSIDEKDPENRWSFYDGPPFATGLPHHGHLLAGTIKDVIPRYWTMKGKRIDRRFGWDCHGLPVEFEIEKQLDLKGRQDIVNYGVAEFNEACRAIVLRYASEWRQTVERMGRWIDFDNDYKTMDPTFMESVWAIFKSLWEKGLIYEDKKVLPYSTRVASPLSNFEANLNYQNTQDPSVYVKFEIKDRPNTFLLVWTTTPWTLPANLGIAANPDFTYVEIQENGKDKAETLILEEKRAKELFAKQGGEKAYTVLKSYPGKNLRGVKYQQLIPAFIPQLPVNAHEVFIAEYVTDDSGTGLVHLAPAYGEDDYRVGKENGLPPLDHLDEQGHFTKDASISDGKYFKDADKDILANIKSRGLLFRQETLQHSYPFCYRSDTPLIYRAISTWFVNVTKIKDDLQANNQKIHWVPEHLKDGRFGKWLEGARDWAISRNRFWGNPIPVWRNEETGESLCVGSIAELEKLTGSTVTDLHKHFVDKLTIVSPKTGDTLTRVPHVLDCWFESGSMPYAQQHYPFSISEADFAKIFPADFIAEGLDQTRGWFYTLLVLSTALGKGAPFKNVVVNGIVLAEDGRKMSKRLKNYPEPSEVLNEFGADTLRIYLLQSGAVHGEDLRFSSEGLREMTRRILLPYWNAYSFLATYASVDGWDPSTSYVENSSHPLDQWIKIKTERLKGRICKEMEAYHLSKTVHPLLTFIDELNNWYIRRSRRRFWKSENDQDKLQAFSTLYYVLTEFTKISAPFIPFLSEYMYGQLRLGHTLAAKDSVHLDEYPVPRAISAQEEAHEKQMDAVRSIVELGRELREKIKIRVRQPLSTLFVGLPTHALGWDWKDSVAVIQEELNVREVKFLDQEKIAHFTIKPNFKTAGKTVGSKMKELQQELKTLSPALIAKILAKETVELLGLSLPPETFQVDLVPQANFEHPSHSDGTMVIALDQTLTDDLKNEGLAREVIHHVQRLRKEMDFNVEDRIQFKLETEPTAQASLEPFVSLIETETLSTLEFSQATGGHEETIEGHTFKLLLRKS